MMHGHTSKNSTMQNHLINIQQASTTREFKEGVFVVHTFQKNVKKKLYFENFRFKYCHQK